MVQAQRAAAGQIKQDGTKGDSNGVMHAIGKTVLQRINGATIQLHSRREQSVREISDWTKGTAHKVICVATEHHRDQASSALQ